MRAFGEAWPDVEFVQQVVALLPWGTNLRLLELSREFPLMSIVNLRIEIERELRDYLTALGGASPPQRGIAVMLSEIQRQNQVLAGSDVFLEALRVMNEAIHGHNVDPELGRQAFETGSNFLAQIQERSRLKRDGS
jgi:hypothetical protein